MNPVLRWLVLNLFILPLRPARSAALYRKIWTDKGSPLLITTLEQARGLDERLRGSARVEVGMRYGNPSIPSAIEKLCASGADRILVFPLFPQYAAPTTASVHDAVSLHLRGRRVVPVIRHVPSFYRHPAYIGALVASVREDLARLPWKPEKLIVSFHGVPRRYVESGDPYRSHAEETTRLLAAELGLGPAEHELSFQSRLGREEWLQPYTERRLEELARSGLRRIAVVCPGFVADCVETIDEIGREGRRRFLEAGGENMHLVPCLNVRPAWIDAMAAIAREELSGWI